MHESASYAFWEERRCPEKEIKKLFDLGRKSIDYVL
jgi:hypothetical protein